MSSSTTPDKKVVAIAGAGPAGLTLAYELAVKAKNIRPILFEASSSIGGLSRTVPFMGNRIDIGGHRFFSKHPRVLRRWEEIKECKMMQRRRVSRIYYLRKFFDYPVSLTLHTLKSLGLLRTLRGGLGFLAARLRPREERNLEDFYINRFGAPLYRMFFEDYTEKVWGIHPSKLGAEWGAQRVKGLSVTAVIKDMLMKWLGIKEKYTVETSLIEQFTYPKHGPGEYWEATAHEITEAGGELLLDHPVKYVNIGRNGKVESITVTDAEGNEESVMCDYFASSIPLRDLIKSIRGIEIPEEVKDAARELPYRDFITVGLLVSELAIKEKGDGLDQHRKLIPDTWIYVQERGVKLGRLQIFNNWSPYMVKDAENTVWIGLEYFCNEGDPLWEMSDSEFINMAITELESIGFIEKDKVLESIRIKVPKAYPGYFGGYSRIEKIREFLDTIPNLFCIGRNGQHRYNNMDHSMLTAMEAADCIISGSTDKSHIWNVNTEQDYHEIKGDPR